MSSSADSTTNSINDQPDEGRRRERNCRGNWSCLNIAAMVAGFVLFWPIGLFMLFWIVSGRDAVDLPASLQRQWSRISDACQGQSGCAGRDSSGNVVFNEFQQAQYERIREIKDEIRNRARRFRDYRANAKRRADEDEFNRFMSDAPFEDQDERTA